MKAKKFTKILSIVICTVLIIAIFPINANADMGPKTSVRIIFENMGDELCYGTLLSKTESTGPSSAWDGTEFDARHNENEYYSYADLDYKTWKAFVEYEDSDGFYFLQEGWQVNETKEIAWTYYPPNTFKILLYYPQTNTFVVSDIYEKYAFDTYYTVDMDGVNIGSVDYNEELSSDDRINAYRSYNYTQEILSLIARIVITIIIEMGVALLFGFRRKKEFLFLGGVNVITQIVLNVLLNIINYNSGQLAFTVYYIFLEIVVFIMEAVLYCTLMKRISERPKKNWFYVVYALVANVVSFATGFVIAHILPGIF